MKMTILNETMAINLDDIKAVIETADMNYLLILENGGNLKVTPKFASDIIKSLKQKQPDNPAASTARDWWNLHKSCHIWSIARQGIKWEDLTFNARRDLQVLFDSANAGGMARELAAQDSESPTKQNG